MATVKVLPAKLNWKIMRGDDFSDVLSIEDENGTPIDVSTYTFTAQLRSTPDGAVVATFSIDMTSAATGDVGYSLIDTVTDDLSGSYVWDLQQETAGGVKRTIVGGTFEVLKDVTRVS